MNLQGVIFDMDGLLFDTERLAAEGWVEAGKRLGFPITAESTRPIRGVTQEESRRLFRELLGDVFDYDLARSIRTQHIQSQIAEKGIPVKAGARELLQYLRQTGLRTALATSSDRCVAEQYLKLAEFEAYFDQLVCGREAGRSKPEPDVFLMASEAIGVSPHLCLVLEDSPNGVKAAHRAGCNVIAVPDTIPISEDIRVLCTAVCKDLTEVLRQIEVG